ncbi:MAG: sel1 repeat family protein [Campylobacteraceae bacterium]|jgi:TPR repeat protein|nr:sel1 repeat family protein [Campylobacteraceae bacterium]
MASKFLVTLFCFGCFCSICLSAEVGKFDSSKLNTYQQSCNNKIAEGCFNVGIAYFLGDGFKKNDAKAKEYLQMAYNLEPKNTSFMDTLARLYYYEYKTKNDSYSLNESIKLFNDACDKGKSNSCIMLGGIYEFGDNNIIKIDTNKALAYYKKSCVLKDIEGCSKFNSLKKR